MSEAAFEFLLVAFCAALTLALVVLTSPPKPIRADPQPTAICLINEDTVTADGTMEWPEGSYAPCKWFLKEVDV